MLLLAVLLLSSSALAADYGNYIPHNSSPVSHNFSQSDSPTPYPLDNNDMHNRDFFKSPINIVYTFEQTKRDQPPHVERREESIAKYIYRSPKVITTPQQIIPEILEFLLNTQFPTLHKPVELYPLQPWNHFAVYPSTVPPPTPKWTNLPEGFNKQTLPNYDTDDMIPNESDPLNQLEIHPTNYQLPDPSFQWSDPTDHDNRKISLQSQNIAPSFTKVPGQETTTTNKPTNHFVGLHPGQSIPQAPQFFDNRGSYKFKQNDIASDDNYQVIKPTAVVIKNSGTPPPIPTLSPWHDGFGK